MPTETELGNNFLSMTSFGKTPHESATCDPLIHKQVNKFILPVVAAFTVAPPMWTDLDADINAFQYDFAGRQVDGDGRSVKTLKQNSFTKIKSHTHRQELSVSNSKD
jgi:hypothetical protein